MKKIIFISMLCISVFLSANAFGESIVVATGEWAPFIGEKLPGKGLHSEVITKVFAKMGFEADIKFMDWKRAYEKTKKGDYIASFTWSDMPERRKEMLYPQNELSLSQEVGFYSKAKHPNGLTVKSFDDIKNQNLKVVGIASYWYENVLKEKGIDVHLVHKADLAWKILDSGRADFLIENIDVGKAEMVSSLGQGKEAGFAMTAPLKEQKMYLIFSAKHPRSKEILEKYDAAVTALKAAGEL